MTDSWLLDWYRFFCIFACFPVPNSHPLQTYTEQEMKGKTPVICFISVSEAHFEAIFCPVVSTLVGCSGDKLAWIKCQLSSRFTLIGPTVNLFKWEQVRQISAGSTSSSHNLYVWEDNFTNRLTDRVTCASISWDQLCCWDFKWIFIITTFYWVLGKIWLPNEIL